MSSAYSMPNRSESVPIRSGAFFTWRRKVVSAPWASRWIICFMTSADSPMSCKPCWKRSFCLSAVANFIKSALMPVAATSGGVFKARKVAPRAFNCAPDRPNSFAVEPARLAMFKRSDALASMLLDRWLMASPNFTTSSWVSPKIERRPVIAAPACWPDRSKATPILAASSAKRSSSSRAMPACPAAATMAPIPSAAIGMRVDIKSTSLDICPNCSGVSKLTTFLTSAITDSKATAGCTRP